MDEQQQLQHGQQRGKEHNVSSVATWQEINVDKINLLSS